MLGLGVYNFWLPPNLSCPSISMRDWFQDPLWTKNSTGIYWKNSTYKQTHTNLCFYKLFDEPLKSQLQTLYLFTLKYFIEYLNNEDIFLYNPSTINKLKKFNTVIILLYNI